MTEERELINVLRELGLPFRKELNTKEKLLSVITEHVLHNPEITALSKESMRVLRKYGFTIVDGEGRRVSL
jgi:hypothetical protein